jgi:TolB-like protein
MNGLRLIKMKQRLCMYVKHSLAILAVWLLMTSCVGGAQQMGRSVPDTSGNVSRNNEVQQAGSGTTTVVTAADELDQAIREASDYLNKNVPTGKKVAVLNIKSSYPPLSEYIIDVLTGNVVNDRVFTVVDRANLALIQQEMDFQLSGEVSDESAQSIGQKLGAQTIVSGSITVFGNLWRLTVRALDVEGAAVQGLFNRNIPNGASIAALTSGGPVTPAPAASASVAQAAPAIPQVAPAESPVVPGRAIETYSNRQPAQAAAPAATYAIGDTGPAGGIVFYDKGSNSGGWRYLEAAPPEIEYRSAWGPSGSVNGTISSIGGGKNNTQLIAAYLQKNGGSGAAQLAEMEVNGYKEWFLPSAGELNLMYVNLKQKDLGGFKNDWYWSSSEDTSNYAWVQDFDDGSQIGNGSYPYYGRKDNGHYVRPIRQF